MQKDLFWSRKLSKETQQCINDCLICHSVCLETAVDYCLKLPEAKYNLDTGSGAHGEQTGKMMAGIEKVLVKEKPDAVLVQGDTNTVLAKL